MVDHTKVPPLVGYKEAAEIIGEVKKEINTKTLAVYAGPKGKGFPAKWKWPPFPEPIDRLACGPLWLKSDIVKFKKSLGGEK